MKTSVKVSIGAFLAALIVWWFWPKPSIDDLVDRAFAAARAGHYDQAISLINRAIRIGDSPGLVLHRAQFQLEANDLDAALESYASIGDNVLVVSLQARLQQAAIYQRKNLLRLAEQSLKSARQLDPGNVDVLTRLCSLYMRQLRRPETVAVLEEIATRRPMTPMELGAYVLTGRYVRFTVLKNLNECVAADPADLDTRFAVAGYHWDMTQTKELEAVSGELLQKLPNDDRARALLVEAKLDKSDLAAAGKLLNERAIDRRVHPWLWIALARFAGMRSRPNDAEEFYRQAIVLDPANPLAHFRLSEVLRHQNRLQDATGEAKTADRLRSYFQLGVDLFQDAVKNDTRRQTQLVEKIAGQAIQLRLWREAELALGVMSRQRSGDATLSDLRSRLRVEGSEPVAKDLARRPWPSLQERGIVQSRPETTIAAEPAEPRHARFVDVAAQAKLDFQVFPGTSKYRYFLESVPGGVTVLDFDNDGWPDLFFPQGCPLPLDGKPHPYHEGLYRNDRDGTFSDVHDAAGLTNHGFGVGAAAADLNNDGFEDVVVGNFGPKTVYRNNGDGTFSDIVRQTGIVADKMSSSVAAADLDRDGALDLYFVHYIVEHNKVCQSTKDGKYYICSVQMYTGEQHALYRNLGDGRFEDATKSSGVVAPNGRGLGIVIADLDNDSWPDIYVANDSSPHFLFHNRTANSPQKRLTFEEVGMRSGAALSPDGVPQAGMGVACADFDGNGFLDLHVTNFYKENNNLYLNKGSLQFVDAVRQSGIAEPSYPMLSWGTQAIDVDGKGWADLFVANGHYDDQRPFLKDPILKYKMPPQFFFNLGKAKFADVSKNCGDYFNGEYLGRGAARLDWNRDGRPDLVVVHQDRPVALLQNETAQVGHRIVVDLVGTLSNRDAINARLRVITRTGRQTIEIIGGDGFLASNERRQFIGVGNADVVERLEIDWPSGRRDSFENLRAEQLFLIVEGRPAVAEPLHPAR